MSAATLKEDAPEYRVAAVGRPPETASKATKDQRRSAESPLRSRGFRVRPDFVFPRQRLAVFVDGCFWHGCPKYATKPNNNAAFWRKKLGGNKRRDALVTRTLRRAGWRVLRI